MNEKLNPILLIEDHAIDLDLTKRAFTRGRLVNPIQVARNGEEALSLLDRWEAGEPAPVCILLDLKLPKVSGLEDLRRIKSHPKFCITPVIVLTTSEEDHAITETYKLGGNSYIVKPVNFNKFVEVASQIEIYWCALNTAPG